MAGAARDRRNAQRTLTSGPRLDPKPPFDLKSAVSQIAMRRHEIEARLSRSETDPTPPDSRTGAFGDRASAPRQIASASSDAGGSERSAAAPRTGAAPPLTQLLLDDVRALARQLDEMRRERAEPSDAAVDLGAMRAEIAAMSQSLADLAPRNAIVALEGAIRDLAQRVEMLRQNGHGESMLAPLEAMAAEFRAALKAHDPQAAAAALEREIRAIGGKVESLAAAAIKPETFERIRQQTEEVRNLLASAALRAPPLERLERQIGELADRVERLGASPAPHFESAEMAALLAEACRQIERSTPPAALISIEQRLEQIATRLDQEIARPTAPVASIRARLTTLRAASTASANRSRRARRQRSTPARSKRFCAISKPSYAAVGRPTPMRRPSSRYSSKSADKLDRLADPEAGARQLEPILHQFGARTRRRPVPD